MKSRFGPALLSLAIVLVPACGSDDDPAGPGDSDTIAPRAVTDLAIQTYDEAAVTVTWTAPGDDNREGTATAYEIAYAATPITPQSWLGCTKLPVCPTPTPAGTRQTAQIDGPPAPYVYVAMRAVDEAGNWSDLSNVAQGHIAGAIGVIQLTSEGSNRYPCLDDGYVTWVGTREANMDEIWIAGLGGITATPSVLTDNGGQKQDPSSHGREKIAWMGREGDGYDWEIFTYSVSSNPRYRAFTDDDVYDIYPALAGGGDFAWLHGWEVHYFDDFTKNRINLTNECCPADTYSNSGVAADDHTVIWSTYERGTREPPRIFRWDGVRREITDLISAFAHDYSMDDGKIAYEWSAQPEMVRYWDGVTVHELGIGSNPSLDDGWVAFEAWDNHDWEIHLWDGVNIIPITDNEFQDYQPSLSGNILAWAGRPDGDGGSYQIFYTKLPNR